MQSWIPLLPEQGSTLAGGVDALYFYLVGVTVFFTTLITLVIIFFAVRYRRRTPFEIPRPIAGSVKLETMWTVIPFIIAMSMFVWGAQLFYEQYTLPQTAMEISVVGKQWMWKIQHPTGQREINELHVPVGRRIKLTMTSEDVIHSFYLPVFRIKADVVPGRYTYEWFEATKPGRYHLFCAEYCGTNHSGMTGWVEVMDPTDFNNWLAGNANQQSPVAAGQQLFQNTLGCASCHGDAGQGGRGPALAALFGKSEALENGQNITADEAYIRESILNPRAKIVAGYRPIMPTFQGQVTEEQLLQLIAFIKSLSQGQTSGTSVTPQSGGGGQRTNVGPSVMGNAPDNSLRSNPVGPTSPNVIQQQQNKPPASPDSQRSNPLNSTATRPARSPR